MGKSVKDLKYVLFTEWSTGSSRGELAYHDAWGDSIDNVFEAGETILEHFGNMIEDGRADDAAKEAFEEFQRDKANTLEYLESLSFDNGKFGFECTICEEGENIVYSVIDFLLQELFEWTFDVFEDEVEDSGYDYDDDDYNEDEEYYKDEDDEDEDETLSELPSELRKIIVRAQNDPEDYDAVTDLLLAASKVIDVINNAR